jgi:hypothetical protein
MPGVDLRRHKHYAGQEPTFSFHMLIGIRSEAPNS